MGVVHEAFEALGGGTGFVIVGAVEEEELPGLESGDQQDVGPNLFGGDGEQDHRWKRSRSFRASLDQSSNFSKGQSGCWPMVLGGSHWRRWSSGPGVSGGWWIW